MKSKRKKWTLFLAAVLVCLCMGCGDKEIDNAETIKEEVETENMETEGAELEEQSLEATEEQGKVSEMTIIFLPDMGEDLEFTDIKKEEKLGEQLREKLLSAEALVNMEGIWKSDGTRLDETEALVTLLCETKKIGIIRLQEEKDYDILEQENENVSIMLAAKKWEPEELNGEVIETMGTREQQLFARTVCKEGVKLLVGYGASQLGSVFAVEKMPVISSLGDNSGDYRGMIEVHIEQGDIVFVKWIPLTYTDTVLEIAEGEAEEEALLRLRTQSGRYSVTVSGLIYDSFWRQSEIGFDINY